jgi:hypothetical protein
MKEAFPTGRPLYFCTMDFKQRISRYLIGVLIGSVVVFIMFPQYDWLSWTPNKALMKQIRESAFQNSPLGNCYVECTGMTAEQIQLIRNEGKIIFDESNAQATPKRYKVVYGTTAMEVLVTDTLVMLHTLNDGKTICNCYE